MSWISFFAAPSVVLSVAVAATVFDVVIFAWTVRLFRTVQREYQQQIDRTWRRTVQQHLDQWVEETFGTAALRDYRSGHATITDLVDRWRRTYGAPPNPRR